MDNGQVCVYGALISAGMLNPNLLERLLQQFLGYLDILAWWSALPFFDVSAFDPSHETYFKHHLIRLAIGLFGLVGIFGVLMGPLGGRVLDRLVPWFGTLISVVGYLLVLCIQLGAGGINIGAVVVVAFGMDIFNQMIQVSVTTAIYGCV